MTTSDLAQIQQLLDVQSGEVLPASPENAHRVLTAAREMKTRLNAVIADATEYLVEESRRNGTKTFSTPAGKVVLSGGTETVYDGEALAELLREAGCPEGRINEVVTRVETVEYKVDRRVLRELTAANPDYAAAAELAREERPKNWTASAK